MTIRILTQLNFSAGENPEGDSGLRFTGELISRIQNRSGKFFFYVLVPIKAMEAARTTFVGPGIELLPVNVPPRLHGGDFAFNPNELASVFDFRKYDVDILFLNQPELVAPFLNYFNRQTFHLVPAFTYVHWFDERRPSTPKQTTHRPALLAALAGILASDSVAFNSQYGVDRVLRSASQWFSHDAINKLGESAIVLPPPIRTDTIRNAKRKAHKYTAGTKRTFVINHRLLKYTGVRQVLERNFPRLWSERQDFDVLITNPSRARLPGSIVQQPWARNGTLSDEDYFPKLWTGSIVLAPHRATHWSISTLEAVGSDCLPLCNRESFFPEMFEPVLDQLPRRHRATFNLYCLFYRQELNKKLNMILDDFEDLEEFRKALGRATRSVYHWERQIPSWIECFQTLYDRIPSQGIENPTVKRLHQIIEQQPSISKDELLRRSGIAVKNRTFSWTCIRKTLHSVSRDDSKKAELVFKRLRRRDRTARKQAGI